MKYVSLVHGLCFSVFSGDTQVSVADCPTPDVESRIVCVYCFFFYKRGQNPWAIIVSLAATSFVPTRLYVTGIDLLLVSMWSVDMRIFLCHLVLPNPPDCLWLVLVLVSGRLWLIRPTPSSSMNMYVNDRATGSLEEVLLHCGSRDCCTEGTSGRSELSNEYT